MTHYRLFVVFVNIIRWRRTCNVLAKEFLFGNNSLEVMFSGPYYAWELNKNRHMRGSSCGYEHKMTETVRKAAERLFSTLSDHFCRSQHDSPQGLCCCWILRRVCINSPSGFSKQFVHHSLHNAWIKHSHQVGQQCEPLCVCSWLYAHFYDFPKVPLPPTLA